MFNKNEYSIYRDSEKRMYAMKDGEKFIIDKILKDDEGVEYVIIDGNKYKCKLML